MIGPICILSGPLKVVRKYIITNILVAFPITEVSSKHLKHVTYTV